MDEAASEILAQLERVLEIANRVAGEQIRSVQVAERCRAAGSTLLPVSQALAEIIDLDPALKPEVEAALSHILEAGGALERAVDFVAARQSTSLEQIVDELGLPT